MPQEVRVKMESAFAADFSTVRIQQGPQATAVGALAYAQGNDIYFAPGQFDPASERGQELLGHELAHVIQQREGRVPGTAHAKGGNINDDPALEREADELGRRAARGEMAAPGKRGPAPQHAGGVGQAKAAPAPSSGARPEPVPSGRPAPDAELLSPIENASLPAQTAALTAQVQTSGLSAPIQRKPDPEKDGTYIPYQIRITQPMTAEQFKVAAMLQIFGAVIENITWNNIKDAYTPDESPTTVYVEISLLKRQRGAVNESRGFAMDDKGGIAGAEQRAKEFQSEPVSDEKMALLTEIDRRYYEATGISQGTLIKPGENGKAELWRTIRDEVLFQHEYIGNLPPQVQVLVQRSIKGRDLTPADYEQLFRIAKKIEKMPPGQVLDYASKVTGSTIDLDVFESSLNKYSNEMALREQQTEEREGIQTKLLGLEEVYKKYREIRSLQRLEAMTASAPYGPLSMDTPHTGLGPPMSLTLLDDLERLLQRHGFASVAAFESFIKRFEQAFEIEAANIAKDLLKRYASKLYKESERYKDLGEVAALHQKLGGFRAQQAEFEKNAAISNEYVQNSQISRLPGLGHLRPRMSRSEAEAVYGRAQAAKQAAETEIMGLADAYPIFHEEGLPLDRRIDKTALARADKTQLGALLQGHTANRLKDVTEALGRIEEKNELIYKMEPLMPLFYSRQGITPGSIFDLIIQDKMRDDAILKITTGILLAILAIGLTVLSLGSATPAIVGTGAAVGSLGLSTYMAYDQYQEYTEEKDLADVGLADDPSVIWLVLAVVGVVFDSATAVKAIKALGPAAKVLNEGGQLAEFNKVVRALQESGEIDAKIAQSVEKAAAARLGFAQSANELTRILSGKFYSFPGPFADPDVFRLLVNMAKSKIQEGVHSAQIFIDELRRARLLAKLDDMTPEELTKAKEAWEQALRLVKSSEKAIDIINPEGGRLIGRYANGSQLEIISRGEKLHGGNVIHLDPDATTTVTGALNDVNVVARRGDLVPGATQMGANPGGINILRSPKWGEIQAKHKAIEEAGNLNRYWQLVTDEFWETVNKPWLDEAIARGDQFRFVSSPTDDVALHVTDKSGKFILNGDQMIKSIFYREIEYLKSNGYTFLPDGTAVKSR